jgi:hypothetical protein
MLRAFLIETFLHDETGAVHLETRSLNDQISAQDQRMRAEQERFGSTRTAPE